MDADNCPVSVKRPAGWDAIAAYSRGGSKPSSDTARKAFDELLINIRLENCVSHTKVVNAMLRRAPSRIEAENFGHNGPGVSYSVKNTTRRSKYYRKSEPVMINDGESLRPRSSQYVTLSSGEWTAYTIDSSVRQEHGVIVRARSANSAAQAELQIGEKTFGVNVTDNAWKDIKLGTIPLNRGRNSLKWVVKQGTVDLDWIDVTSESKAEESTTARPTPAPR